ncbi:MAG TPA: hypothetical protein VF147_08835 [Vicinamibacterales bacterium]
MIRWRAVVAGALTFLAAHGMLLAGWRTWFEPGGAHTAWFLNSGRGVAFTAICLAAGAAIAGAVAHDKTLPGRIAMGAAFAAGAVIAMACVLITGDPGTIFPIVLALGGAVALVSGLAGALAGGALRTALSGR